VLESVLYHSAFKKQNVLPERARDEQIQHFLENMNSYAGTSEQNGHVKETSKAAAYS